MPEYYTKCKEIKIALTQMPPDVNALNRMSTMKRKNAAKPMTTVTIGTTSGSNFSLNTALMIRARQYGIYCERIKEARSPMVIKTYEDKIEELEMEQLRLGESDKKPLAQRLDFETALHRVFDFIKNPLLMWQTDDLAQKRLVLRMIFEKPLVYDAKLGVYTATLSLPVKVSTIPELDRMMLVEHSVLIPN